MQQIFEVVKMWTITSSDEVSSISLPIVVIIFLAIGLPLLHAMTGKKNKWTDPMTILFGYVALIVLSLFSLLGLGMTLNNFAPETFNTWWLGESDFNPVIMFYVIAYATPLAFGISSIVYGVLGGWKKFVFGLFGIAAAVGLEILVTIGVLHISCSGWGGCL